MPGSGDPDPGATNRNPGGSREPVVMLTLNQLRRFGPRDVRMLLEFRPASKGGTGVVVPFERPR